MKTHIEQRDSMRIAPARAQQLASKRANVASKYQGLPTCSNPECIGACHLCGPTSRATGLVQDEAADQAARLGKAIVRAHRYASRHSTTPAIVKRRAAYTSEQEANLCQAIGREAAEREIRDHNRNRIDHPAILRSAAQQRDKVRRAKIAVQATRDAADFRRVSADP